MSTSQKMIIVLTIITMFAGGILSTWDGVTRPLIEAYKLQELKKAIATNRVFTDIIYFVTV